jgi:hypothetical protein
LSAAQVLEAHKRQPMIEKRFEQIKTVHGTFKPFIQRFASTTHAVARVLEILKNQGLDQAGFQKCWQICQSLPTRSKVKKRLQSWLHRHLEIQKRLTDLPLLVSSDIIDSLFGSFKLNTLLNAAHKQT